MFAGNLGEAQDIANVFNTIECLKEKEVYWIILGSGRKYDWLNSRIAENNLGDKVKLLGHKPVEEMPAYFSLADIMLVSLKNEPIFSLTSPAKIQAYMASKKMIVGMLNGEGARIIEEANCGFTCNAGDYKRLADNVIKAYNLKPEERNQLGLNGYKYYLQNFSKEKAIENIEEIIGNNLSNLYNR